MKASTVTTGFCTIDLHSAAPVRVLHTNNVRLYSIVEPEGTTLDARANEGGKMFNMILLGSAIVEGNTYEISATFGKVFVKCMFEGAPSLQDLDDGWVTVKEINLDPSAMKLVLDFEFPARYQGGVFNFKGSSSFSGVIPNLTEEIEDECRS